MSPVAQSLEGFLPSTLQAEYPFSCLSITSEPMWGSIYWPAVLSSTDGKPLLNASCTVECLISLHVLGAEWSRAPGTWQTQELVTRAGEWFWNLQKGFGCHILFLMEYPINSYFLLLMTPHSVDSIFWNVSFNLSHSLSFNHLRNLKKVVCVSVCLAKMWC